MSLGVLIENIVKAADASDQAHEAIAQRIGFLRETEAGALWRICATELASVGRLLTTFTSNEVEWQRET